jgi:hypothetical protein
MKFLRFFLCLIFVLASDARSETPIHVPLINPADTENLPESFQDATLFNRRPFITSYWTRSPAIRVCKASGVTVQRAERAADFWRRLGYSFGEIFLDDGSSVCRSGGLPGEIIILLVNANVPMGDNIALTKTYYYTDSRHIIRSQIYINSYSADKERVLEHEIGHALGWMHYNRSYHIMHREYRRGGHTSSGLRYSEYLSQSERINQ